MKNLKPKFISVDIEADGPAPGLFSMLSIGAVVVSNSNDEGFYSTLAPISQSFELEALKACNFTRQESLSFTDPKKAMEDFSLWLKNIKGDEYYLVFWSDNNGFDWSFINYYFHAFLGYNPFGHSSSNIGSFYKGNKGFSKSFKHLRETKHSHNALDDAKGNAEALRSMILDFEPSLAKRLGLS